MSTSENSPRKILHIDMDCFYAAVEVKHNSDLRGLPLGIGGPADSRSVLCTASYEARKFGVRSAMPSAQAARLCPSLVLIPPNFALYKKESRAVHEIFARFSDKVQSVSLDEAYLDVTDSPHFNGSATRIAQEIRRLIAGDLRLTASAGAAPNKFLAKIASDWKKPDGLFVIRPREVDAFVKGLRVEKIHGVGKVTAAKFHHHGLFTCGDIQARSADELRSLFGSRGEELARMARGIDDRPVDGTWERKSLNVEETYWKDLHSLDACLQELPELYGEWERRMKKGDHFAKIRGFVIKVKFSDFLQTTHETSSRAIPSLGDFENLLRKAWARRAAPVRLLGLGARFATVDSALPEQLRFAF